MKYTGGRLNRAATRRKDAGWIAAHLRHPDSRFIPVWQSQNLIAGLDGGGDGPAAVTLGRDTATRLGADARETAFLGLDGARAVFAVDVSALDQGAVLDLAGAGTFCDLRQAGPVLGMADAALLAYARGILHWHREHLYCGRCGGETVPREGGHVRACVDGECGKLTFPRTDPAVIMLVVAPPLNGEPAKCLMGRNHRFPPGTYSTLAGFVEPGESLEEAVAREVDEESGIAVKAVRYLGSQPWPFPSSLMLGFHAEATSTEIRIDPEELSDAQWFSAAELRTFGEWGDETAERCLPRRDSIARFLIETWLRDVH